MAKRKNTHSTAITSASSIGDPFRYPKNYKRISRGQFNAVFGSGKISEAGTTGSAVGRGIGSLVRRQAAKSRAAKATSAKGPRGRIAQKEANRPQVTTKPARSSAGPGSPQPKPAVGPRSRIAAGAKATAQARQKSQAAIVSAKQEKAKVARAKTVSATKRKAVKRGVGLGAAVGGVGVAGAATRYELKPKRPTTTGASSSGKPKVGDTKMLGGRKARYDGKNWVAAR